MVPGKRKHWREKKARYRRLLKSGGGFLVVPLGDKDAVTAALLDFNWLDPRQSENKKMVAKAAGALLDDLGAWHKKDCLAWTDSQRTWSYRRKHDE